MNEPTSETEFLPPVSDGDAPDVEAREEFAINTIDAANWYLRRLANLEAEKQRVTQQSAAIVAQLDADAETLRYLYEGQLQNFVRQELAANGNRRKSLHFLQGTACFRHVGPSLRITDNAAALDFCRRNLPDAVKVTETLDTTRYRDFAEKMQNAGAESLPVGVESVPAREAFRVTFGGKPE